LHQYKLWDRVVVISGADYDDRYRQAIVAIEEGRVKFFDSVRNWRPKK
jgi:nicotinamide riboside kinase